MCMNMYMYIYRTITIKRKLSNIYLQKTDFFQTYLKKLLVIIVGPYIQLIKYLLKSYKHHHVHNIDKLFILYPFKKYPIILITYMFISLSDKSFNICWK